MKIKVKYIPQYEQLEDSWVGEVGRYEFHCQAFYEMIPF